ncbi:antibiotic biosynthesis monooxygenase family protein [Rheinheimera baltica]|uniref:antibiotic biosynthesis monooxygenase family protein n=1 Tax=Rheinheimera baltica TaxID=67576 RepID=UPI00047FC622|nr:antibiotic biosynthesis monooxygenase [Rheinheimera baltica]
MKSLSKKLSVLVLSVTQSACLFSSPMHWDKKLTAEPEQQTLVMAVTHVKLGKNSGDNEKFWHGTYQVLDSLTQYEGYLGHKVRRSLSGREAWTLTLWQNEADLKQFVKSTVHDAAAKEGFLAVSTARSFHLTTSRSALQTEWRDVEALMDEYGSSMY